MRLLKNNTPSIWEYLSQQAFDNLKHAITHSSVLHPPNCSKDYLLYLAASTTTFVMVLVQEDRNDMEHVNYFLSKSFLDSET